MSIIEQATRRLEELKRAGVEVPTWEPNSATPAAQPATPLHGGAAAPSAPPTGATPTSVTPIHRIEPLRPVEPYPGSNPAVGSGSANAGSTNAGSTYGSHAAAGSSAHDRAAGSSARDRAAGTVASGALVRVGLRQSKSVELDLAQLAEAGYLVPGAPRSPLADEFRGIKQPVLKNVRGEAGQAGAHTNLIMVTSALAGEGKTFCSLNLALSIASEVDSSVLLVDADVVRPSVMNRLGLQGRFKGLLDLLSDTSLELPDLILKTNIPKLAVLPAGAPSIHSTELLASDAMQELLNDIATRYPDRIVIFDAPPLLSTTESRVLAARMGQIIMVVSAGTTSELDIKQAFTALEHCPTVLCLLNRSSNDSDQRHYGYYAQ